MRNPFAAFGDPKRRPFAVFWTIFGLLMFALVYMVAQDLTSQRWFCNDVCHNVHADNAYAYWRSPHNKVSCIACHYKVGLNPVAFALDRADKLLDVMPTITNSFEKPVNEFSHYASTTSAEQCTQCHGANALNSGPVAGIEPGHTAHAEREIACAMCHNRVSHPEDFELTLPENRKKEVWTTMTACFRCHELDGGGTVSGDRYKASGECSVCHVGMKEPVAPIYHEQATWDRSGHAAMASQAASFTTSVRKVWEEKAPAFYAKGPRPIALLGEYVQGGEIEAGVPIKVPPTATVFVCSTCHSPKDCDDCHAKSGVKVELPAWSYESYVPPAK